MLTLKLKKIDPVKWATAIGLMYALLTSIIVVPVFLFALLAGSSSGFGDSGFGILGGGIAMLFVPVLYGVIGFIIGLIGTFLFNFILKKINGVDIEFEKVGLSIDQIGTDSGN